MLSERRVLYFCLDKGVYCIHVLHLHSHQAHPTFDQNETHRACKIVLLIFHIKRIYGKVTHTHSLYHLLLKTTPPFIFIYLKIIHFRSSIYYTVRHPYVHTTSLFWTMKTFLGPVHSEYPLEIEHFFEDNIPFPLSQRCISICAVV